MPYKHTEKLIPRKHDKRVKLTYKQKESIKEEYREGNISQRKLAQKYNVSRRLIQFIIDPSKEKRNKELFKERRKDGRYYKKEKHTGQIRVHRQYKQELNLENKLEEK